MITVTIAYKNNPANLAVLLAQLQPQLHPNDDIHIIDSSPDRKGLAVASQYGTSRCVIIVSIAAPEDALKFGVESMTQNEQEGLLFLSENCFVSSTFVVNMKKALKSDYTIVSPVVHVSPFRLMDPNFKHYNPENELVDIDQFSANCFILKGDTKSSTKYGLLKNEYVVVVPPGDTSNLTT